MLDLESKPKMIDLFCGVGAGAYGFVKAGFEIVAAVDIDEDAAILYNENLGIQPIVGDLRKVSAREILERAGLKPGEVALVVGCPPCQAFSSLRRTSRRKRQRDNRKSLLRVFGNRVRQIRPEAVVLENVSGLARGQNAGFLREFVRRMRKVGYSCRYNVLDAADYGVPQRRKRLILVGVRNGEPSLPQATYRNSRARGSLPTWRTVGSAIGNLPNLRPGKSDPNDPLHSAPAHCSRTLRLIEKIPLDGGSRKDLPKRMWLDCHKELEGNGAGSVYGRLSLEAPSGTITTRPTTPSCGRFVHPTQDRGLTLREAARLQTIPDEYVLQGTRSQLGTWIGNAMPPLLAERVGTETLRTIREVVSDARGREPL